MPIIWFGWKWCESISALRSGFRYRDMEQADGVFIAVVEANCRYLRPARFDDEVIILATMRSANHQRWWNSGTKCAGAIEELLATGFTKHMFVNREMSVVRLPRALLGHVRASPKPARRARYDRSSRICLDSKPLAKATVSVCLPQSLVCRPEFQWNWRGWIASSGVGNKVMAAAAG